MANTKFKVGDKVVVKKDLKAGDKYGDVLYSSGMRKRFGDKVMTIKDTSYFGCYSMEEDYFPYYIWTDEMLDPAPEVAFTKSDLKDGMVVRTRDKGDFLVVGDVLLDDYEKINLNNYKNDLIHNASPILDIMAVYSVQTCAVEDIYDAICVDDACHKVIWERKEEHKEMTVEEIEEKLGYKVKIVGEDK